MKDGLGCGTQVVAGLTLEGRADLKHQSLLLKQNQEANSKKQQGAASGGPSVTESLVDEFYVVPLGQTPKSTPGSDSYLISTTVDTTCEFGTRFCGAVQDG